MNLNMSVLPGWCTSLVWAQAKHAYMHNYHKRPGSHGRVILRTAHPMNWDAPTGNCKSKKFFSTMSTFSLLPNCWPEREPFGCRETYWQAFWKLANLRLFGQILLNWLKHSHSGSPQRLRSIDGDRWPRLPQFCLKFRSHYLLDNQSIIYTKSEKWSKQCFCFAMNSLTTHINRGHFNLSCTTHLLSICLLVRRHCHASVHSPSPGPHRYVPLVAHVSTHTFPSKHLACDLCTLTGQVIGETLGTTNEIRSFDARHSRK